MKKRILSVLLACFFFGNLTPVHAKQQTQHVYEKFLSPHFIFDKKMYFTPAEKAFKHCMVSCKKKTAAASQEVCKRLKVICGNGKPGKGKKKAICRNYSRTCPAKPATLTELCYKQCNRKSCHKVTCKTNSHCFFGRCLTIRAEAKKRCMRSGVYRSCIAYIQKRLEQLYGKKSK